MRRGRRIVIAGGLVTLGVTAVAVAGSFGAIVDAWYVRGLENANEEAVDGWIDSLAARRSRRAARHFLEKVAIHRVCGPCGFQCPRDILERLVPALEEEELPFLREALSHGSEQARSWTLDHLPVALDRDKEPLPPAPCLELLLRALGDVDFYIRVKGLEMLADLNLSSAPLSPALLDSIVSTVEALTTDETWTVREAALTALAQAAPPPRALPGLRRLRGDAEPRVRSAALAATVRVCLCAGDPGSLEEARDAFAVAWRDGASLVRTQAVELAHQIGQVDDSGLLSFLILALRDTDPSVRVAAAWAISASTSNPERAAGVFEAMRAAGTEARDRAIAVFVRSRDTAVPFLRGALRDTDPEIRSWAAENLARLGVPGGLGREEIQELLATPGFEHRVWALEGTDALSAPEAKPVLLGALRHPSESVRVKSTRLLRERGLSGDAVVAGLEGALGDAARAARISAAVTLLGMDPRHPQARLLLDGELRTGPLWAKVFALRELRTVGERAGALAEALGTAARDPSSEVRENADLTLAAIRGSRSR